MFISECVLNIVMSSSMKIVCVLFIVLIPSLATKEYQDDITQLLEDPNLILELVKRLGSDQASSQKKSIADDKHSTSGHRDAYVPTVRGSSRSCKTRLFERTIIRTEDSRKAGSIFLGSAEDVYTNDQCLSRCCSKKNCDLAVYENKTKHNCYLFQCRDAMSGESNCKFASHADYLSTTLTTFDEGSTDTELVSDSTSDEDNLGASLEKATELAKPVPTEPKPTARPTQLPHSVALGRRCELDVSCEDPHANCYKGTCQCQHNYSQKYGVCREVCGADQVECKRRGTARIGPDCIPKTHMCDGTIQCADGSDERDCKPASVVDKGSQAWQGNPRPGRPNVDSYHDGMDYGYNRQTSQSPSIQPKDDSSEDGHKIGSTGNYVDKQSSPIQDKAVNGYNKDDDKSKDYMDYSTDVDKELEAMTVAPTKRPNVKPTFHPTKPVVSWYGKDSSEGDRKDTDSYENNSEGGSNRVHRVDTTVDETGHKEKVSKPQKQKVVSAPKGDRPEALPRPPQKDQTKITKAPQPEVEPSQTSLKSSHQDKPFKPAASSQSESRDRNNNVDGYQTFSKPYSSKTKGRQYPRPQKIPSDASPDYDSSRYGMGQQRPYPMQRPVQPSWPKGNYRKYPDNGFNHPYLGGYNYDYNDYDPYVPQQGQDFNRQYGSHDNAHDPGNSYGGGILDVVNTLNHFSCCVHIALW